MRFETRFLAVILSGFFTAIQIVPAQDVIAQNVTYTSVKDSKGKVTFCGVSPTGTSLGPGVLNQKKRFIAASTKIDGLLKAINKLSKTKKAQKKNRAKIKALQRELKRWESLIQSAGEVCNPPPPAALPTNNEEGPAHNTTPPVNTNEPTAAPLPTTESPQPTALPQPTFTATPRPTANPLAIRTSPLTDDDVRYLYEKAALGAVPPGAYEVARNGGIDGLLNFMMTYNPQESDVLQFCSRFLDHHFAKDNYPPVTATGISHWAYCNLIESRNPFHDRFTYFFMNNLLVVSVAENDVSPPLIREQFDLFRSYSLGGSYRDLVKTHARHPATLSYLNLATSSLVEPNEDFARELMQLYTLGEYNPLKRHLSGTGRNYNENDISIIAKAITGHGLQYVNASPPFLLGVIRKENVFKGKVTLFPADSCAKVIPEDRLRTDPLDDEVIDHIFDCKPVEDYLAYRILKEYMTEDVQELILNSQFAQEFAKKIRKSNFDLKESLRNLFKTEEFWKPKYRDSIVTTYVEQHVQTLRRVGYRVSGDLMNQDNPFAHVIAGIDYGGGLAGHKPGYFPSVFGHSNLEFADVTRRLQSTNHIRWALNWAVTYNTVTWRCNSAIPRQPIPMKTGEIVSHLDKLMNANLSPAGQELMRVYLDSEPVALLADGSVSTRSSPFKADDPNHEPRVCGVIEMMAAKNWAR
jgi:hypothetical protein